MSKKVSYKELTHFWKGTAITRDENGLNEIDLGVKKSTKRLTEKGAEELYKPDSPKNTIKILVEKLEDVKVCYYMDLDEFMKYAKEEVKEG